MKTPQKMQLEIILTITSLFFFAVEGFGHSMWTQRNEPGYWTVALYHCDENINPDFHLINAGSDAGYLNLALSSKETNPIQSVSAKAWYLNQAIMVSEPSQFTSETEADHPIGDMSIELWVKMLDSETDIQLGFIKGVSLRIAFSNEGDRFHLLGTNSKNRDDQTYTAPGFDSFPRYNVWNHFGVAIHAPNVEKIDDFDYRYGEGCAARFFFNSHAVGYVDNRILSLKGMTFRSTSPIFIAIQKSGLIIDEIQISRVDWTDPLGHGGESHGTIAIEHAFENGRVPATNIEHWCLF